jgi:hypothetical protein
MLKLVVTEDSTSVNSLFQDMTNQINKLILSLFVSIMKLVCIYIKLFMNQARMEKLTIPWLTSLKYNPEQSNKTSVNFSTVISL